MQTVLDFYLFLSSAKKVKSPREREMSHVRKHVSANSEQ